MPRMRTSKIFAYLLSVLAFPILIYSAVRVAPALVLGGLGGCRQVRARTGLIADEAHPVCAAIIGASAGIGQDLANLLSEHNSVKLLVTSRTLERAKNALPAFKHKSMVLASALDLSSDASIDDYAKELSKSIETDCNNKLDYLFLNAGQVYTDSYNGSFVSSDGVYDYLFRVNFVSYVRLLKKMMERMNLGSTRVVFVSSVAHYTGIPRDVLKPNLSKKLIAEEQMSAYSTSKLAFSTLQQVLSLDGTLPNSVAVTCGAALTTIGLSDADRLKGKTMQTELGRIPNWLQFTSTQGAEIVLSAALLRREETRPGEFVLPYFYGFSSLVSERSKFSFLPRWLRVHANIIYEHLFQKMTYQKGRVWVCPASVESRNITFQGQIKSKFWTSHCQDPLNA